MRNLSHSFTKFVAAVQVVAALFTLTGCAVEKRTNPVSNLFLEDRDVSVKDKTLPFDHAWVEPNFPLGHYHNVYFRSVTLSKLPPESWKDSKSVYITSEADFMKESQLLADYFLEQLKNKVEKYPKGTMKVVDKPMPDGLVIDLAITENEFSQPIENTGALLVPVPGSAMLFSAISDPHVAFAARVYDGKTGKLVATAADRKFPPTRLLDLNKVTVTSPNREIVSTWANIIAEALNRDGFAKVESQGTFSILPW